MSLPGKYCIGLLAEDNPLKSFFCFRPVLLEEEDRFAPFEHPEHFPEQGCIRIVPDKNESSHFKTRMRMIGSFAVVDLRNHIGESDKIRPNKNYRGDGVERNAHIIYSDVVAQPPAGTIFSLLDLRPEEAENQTLPAAPLSREILLCVDGAPLAQIWRCAQDEHDPELTRLVPSGEEADLESLQTFEIPDGANETAHIAVSKQLLQRSAEPARAPQTAPKAEPV
ncbi:MAG: hypothetical protein IJ074_08765, partial [Clostridia bacterium]|nr:hypothetical protein [Clostridia bacterium]